MSSAGLDRTTGRILRDWDHVVQSIGDILTTPVMTRVLRRAYGSKLIDLVDRPTNDSTLLAVYVATAEALAAWEPRFQLEQVYFSAAGADGRTEITLDGIYLPDGHRGDDTPDRLGTRSITYARLDTGRWRQIV